MISFRLFSINPFLKGASSMSHVVTIQAHVKDPAALASACRRLGLAEPAQETVELYSGKVTGLALRLPNWQYPVVVDLREGVLHYDNYQEQWGEQVQLDRLLQAYSVEKTKLEARKKNCSVTEQLLEDGSIKLQIIEAGS
jgi:hypothetical protein